MIREIGVTKRLLAHDAIVSSMLLIIKNSILVTASQDGTIALWSLPDFTFYRRLQFGPYAMSLARGPTGDVFYVGFANGQIIAFNSDLEQIARAHLHNDCISAVYEFNSSIITVSYDGYLVWSDIWLNTKKRLNLNRVIINATIFGDHIFIISNQHTLRVNLRTEEVEVLGEIYERVEIIMGELYGVSGARRLVRMKTNKNVKIPVSHAFAFEGSIYGVDANIIYFLNAANNEVCWKCEDIPEGVDCCCVLVHEKRVYLALSNGEILIFSK